MLVPTPVIAVNAAAAMLGACFACSAVWSAWTAAKPHARGNLLLGAGVRVHPPWPLGGTAVARLTWITPLEGTGAR